MDVLVQLLQHYNPLETKYNEKNEAIFDPVQAPILYDLYEQYGLFLHICCKLGWKYVCKCANTKIASFINKNWVTHLLACDKSEGHQTVSYNFCCICV